MHRPPNDAHSLTGGCMCCPIAAGRSCHPGSTAVPFSRRSRLELRRIRRNFCRCPHGNRKLAPQGGDMRLTVLARSLDLRVTAL